MKKPLFVTMDLEGVLIPEIWLGVAAKTGLDELKVTTREIKDYDELMALRLKILDRENISLKDIEEVIATLDPLEGACEYMDWVRSNTQIIILSDTFYQFAGSLIKKLGSPTLLCHTLQINEKGMIADYKLRVPDGKKKAVKALKSLGYHVISIGDSYNDVSMLGEADLGVLFHAPENVISDYPQFMVKNEYSELKTIISEYL